MNAQPKIQIRTLPHPSKIKINYAPSRKGVFQHYLKRQTNRALLQIKLEIAHKSMKRYSRPDPQCKQQILLKSELFEQRQILTPKTPINPIILQHDVDSESGAKQDGKFSMEDLCRVFIERIGLKSKCQFQAKELVQITGVKQRRIYDLMNILQGCGFMRRISKGTYFWQGFEETEQVKCQKEGRKKEATSLSNLASCVKNLLYNAPNYIDFKDICQQILDENSSNNPDSIKRRVYECCKILKIVGLIDKRQHTFKWITKEDRQRTHDKTQHVKKSRFYEFQTETQGKGKDRSEYIQHLTSEFVNIINSQTQFKERIKILQEKFQKKNNHAINPRKLFC